MRDLDRILVLRDGVVAEQGSHEELYSRGGEYTKLYSIYLQDDSRREKEENA